MFYRSCQESVAPRPKDHPDTWRDSAVEIFLNPSGDRKTYYQLIVNPAGSWVDTGWETLEGQRKADDSWNSGAKVAVKINPDSWVVEMAVPFKSIGFEPKPGAGIVANFGRSRHLKSDVQDSQWGAVVEIEIESRRGEECRLMNPWNRLCIVQDVDGPSRVLEGDLLRFTTTRGSQYWIRPAD